MKLPESSVEDIEKLLKDCPCSAATRRCWVGISREMRENLDEVRVTAVWSWDYSLWEFARHRFGYGGGSYWSPKTLPPDFSEARKLPY